MKLGMSSLTGETWKTNRFESGTKSSKDNCLALNALAYSSEIPFAFLLLNT